MCEIVSPSLAPNKPYWRKGIREKRGGKFSESNKHRGLYRSKTEKAVKIWEAKGENPSDYHLKFLGKLFLMQEEDRQRPKRIARRQKKWTRRSWKREGPIVGEENRCYVI